MVLLLLLETGFNTIQGIVKNAEEERLDQRNTVKNKNLGDQ